MARRTDHTRDQLQTLIVDAAQTIIVTKGIAGLSTREIARTVGYVQGTLYEHFRDINEILLHVNRRTLQGLIDRMAALDGDAREPAARLHAYADIYLTYVTSNRDLWEAMFRGRREPNEIVPDWYRGQIDDLVARVEACFDGLKPNDQHLTPRQAAQLVWASVHSICSLANSGRLALVLQQDLAVAIHRIVDVHIAAYAAHR
jgi:AcrR family transcriptional regulator